MITRTTKMQTSIRTEVRTLSALLNACGELVQKTQNTGLSAEVQVEMSIYGFILTVTTTNTEVLDA